MLRKIKLAINTVIVTCLIVTCVNCTGDDDPVNPSDKTPKPSTPIPGEVDLGTWSSAAPMPTSRRGISNMTIELDGLIYALGGISQEGQITNSLDIYDIKNDTWASGKDMPLATWRASVAKHQGKLYLIGGFTSLQIFPFEPTNRVFEYDPSTDIWKERAPMPTKRGSALAMHYNSGIHVLGGANKLTLNTHEVYYPETNSWSRSTPMKESRSGLTGLVYRGNIYVMGGYKISSHGSEIVNRSMELYNGFADIWKPGVELPVERKGMDATLLNNKIYVFGGNQGDNISLTLELDPATGVWTQLAEMPIPLSFMGANAFNNTIYVLGGSPLTRNDTPESVNTNRKFKPPE